MQELRSKVGGPHGLSRTAPGNQHAAGSGGKASIGKWSSSCDESWVEGGGGTTGGPTAERGVAERVGLGGGGGG